MIVEAAKSHGLPSASWRPKKAGGTVQSESEGLRTNGVTPSLRAGKDKMGRHWSAGRQETKKG